MLILWHVKSTASQNGAIPHINRSIFQVLFTVIHSSVLILLRKSKNDGAILRNMLFMDPV